MVRQKEFSEDRVRKSLERMLDGQQEAEGKDVAGKMVRVTCTAVALLTTLVSDSLCRLFLILNHKKNRKSSREDAKENYAQYPDFCDKNPEQQKLRIVNGKGEVTLR